MNTLSAEERHGVTGSCDKPEDKQSDSQSVVIWKDIELTIACRAEDLKEAVTFWENGTHDTNVSGKYMYSHG